MPSGAATPEVLPGSEAPETAPNPPQAITPPPSPDGTGARSPVHLGDGADEALFQPVSLSPSGGRSLPAGVSVMVVEP
jgi:hypothetical protein